MSGSSSPFEIKRPKKKSSDDGLWLMSFSDLSCILISFFILLLSFSKIDKQKFDNVQTGMSAKKATQDNLKTMAEKLDKEIKQQHLEDSMQVKLDSDGLAVEFKDAMLFSSGSADANPKFATAVGPVMAVIAKTPDRYSLHFEGHTDDVPMKGGAFNSNWELASARGLTLLQQFQVKGIEEARMNVISYAHTRPKVAIANLTGDALQRARAANRRVVIRID